MLKYLTTQGKIVQRSLIILALFQVSALFAQTEYIVETIPNVKLITNSYVSNPDKILSAATVAEIDASLSKLESETTVQIAVVAVNSIGDADIFDFAQRLFMTWGIGQAKKDNGLLILLVTGQRTVRFHTGDGLEGVLPDALCKEIEERSMVPSFRNEDYDEGMRAGVAEVVNVLSNPDYHAELMDSTRRQWDGWNDFFPWALCLGVAVILAWYYILLTSGGFDIQSKKTNKKIPYPGMRMSRTAWLITFGVMPVGLLLACNYITIPSGNHIVVFFLLLYGYFALTLIYKRIKMARVAGQFVASKNFFAAATFFNDYQVHWLWMAILVPVPFLPLYFQYRWRKKFFRDHPRSCSTCAQPAKKLDETADDAYLKKSQVFEEQIESVDYDVWLCTACSGTQVFNFVNRFSTYEKCPFCQAKAMYTASRHTIEAATTSSTGRGEQTDVCKFCHKKKVTTYTIARLQESSGSDSGGSSGSSGGSWGGGSSGGGGASSSW